MCIYSCVVIITTALITRGPVQWPGQLVMHYVYIKYIYFPHDGLSVVSCLEYSGGVPYIRLPYIRFPTCVCLPM